MYTCMSEYLAPPGLREGSLEEISDISVCRQSAREAVNLLDDVTDRQPRLVCGAPADGAEGERVLHVQS